MTREQRMEAALRLAEMALVDLSACDDPECSEPNCLRALPAVRAALSIEEEAEAVGVAVKPLDLSNLLKHAFGAGYTSAAGDNGWLDYDPTTCPSYDRIYFALVSTVQEAEPVATLSIFESTACNGRKSGRIQGFDDLVKSLSVGEHPLYTRPSPPTAISDEQVEAGARAAFDTWWDGRGPGREPSWHQTKDRWLKEARATLEAALSATPRKGEGE